jgi:hypothetical protein
VLSDVSRRLSYVEGNDLIDDIELNDNLAVPRRYQSFNIKEEVSYIIYAHILSLSFSLKTFLLPFLKMYVSFFNYFFFVRCVLSLMSAKFSAAR